MSAAVIRGRHRLARCDSGETASAVPHSGDCSAVAPPVPIPNTAVKRCSPDGSTAIGRARVGRRQNKNSAELISAGFLFSSTLSYFEGRHFISSFFFESFQVAIQRGRRPFHRAKQHAAKIEFADIRRFAFALKLPVGIGCLERANESPGTRPCFCSESAWSASGKMTLLTRKNIRSPLGKF